MIQLDGMFAKLLDLLFPKRCLGCRQMGYYLCPNCLATIPPTEPIELPDTFAAVTYHDRRVKQSLWLLKYKRHQVIAGDMAGLLYDRILEVLADERIFREGLGKILVVPVPITARRRRGRGFNQAESLARELVARERTFLRLEINLIQKIKETPTQVSLRNRSLRLKNLQGAFAIKNQAALVGQTIIIVDDILTTGATINEVRQLLYQAGAKKVFGLVVAHG